MYPAAEIFCGLYGNLGKLEGYHLPDFKRVSDHGVIGYASAVYMVRSKGALCFNMKRVEDYPILFEIDELPSQYKLSCSYIENFKFEENPSNCMNFIQANEINSNKFKYGVEEKEGILNIKFEILFITNSNVYSICINPLGGFYVNREVH
ncbi:hypothetical protein [Novosphingobium sp.]|uniref:hypothetical protein n=1 Tax=Novosphingobium sp. TaxID=1874826 RepID=UPI003B52C6D2